MVLAVKSHTHTLKTADLKKMCKKLIDRQNF